MKQLIEVVRSLPQASHISDEAMQRWVSRIQEWQPERAQWHAKRLFGFGGSEVGAVIRHLLGMPTEGFTSLPNLIQQKLLQRMPEFETHHMRRGTTLERLAQLAFHYKYNTQSDTAALSTFALPHGKQGLEWLGGNPDDIVQIKGQRFVVDYKVPNTFDTDVSFDYDAQLHHYHLGAELRGVRCKSLILAKLDLAPQLARSIQTKIENNQFDDEQLHAFAKTIASTNIEGLRIVGIVVDVKRSMQRDIVDCGSEAWNHYVLKGVVPASDAREVIELSEIDAKRLEHLQSQYVLAKSGMAKLDTLAQQASQSIITMLDGVDYSTHRADTPLVDLRAKQTIDKHALVSQAISLGASKEELGVVENKPYDITALVNEIKRLGGDAESPTLFQPATESAPSPDKAKAFLEAEGVDLSPFTTSSVSVVLSTKKDAKQLRSELEHQAGEVFFKWVDEITQTNQVEPADEQGFTRTQDSTEASDSSVVQFRQMRL